MFHDIDPDTLAVVRGGIGENTEQTTTSNGFEANIKRSNMAMCLNDVARRCENDKNNSWMFGLLTDHQKVGQCKADNAPIQCFDDPPNR